MIDLDSIRRHLDAERRTLAPQGWSIEILPSVTRIRSADGSHNSIVFSSLPRPGPDRPSPPKHQSKEAPPGNSPSPFGK
jgi:hypothetical protein